MNKRTTNSVRLNLASAIAVSVSGCAFAQFIDTSGDRVKAPLAVNLKRIGTLKPRPTTAIELSRISVWLDSRTPTNLFKTTPVDVTIENGNLNDPVWVDLLTGDICGIPKNRWSKLVTTYRFNGVPVYDSPVLIADKSAL